MTRFRYTALTSEGRDIEGEIQATTEREAVRTLEARGLTPVRIQPGATRRRGRQRPATKVEARMALQELATMLEARVPIAEALAAQSNTHSESVAEAFRAMLSAIQRGGRFAPALEDSGLPFPGYVAALAHAGEGSGSLASTLRDAADQMEYDAKVSEELRTALIYPAVLVGTGLVAVGILFIHVVPRFANLLDRAEDLPILAWLVLSIGKWCGGNVPTIATVVMLGATATIWAFRKPDAAQLVRGWLEAVPVLGDWMRDADIATWAKTLGTLMGHRVPVLEAMRLAQLGVRSHRLGGRLGEAAKALKSGRALAEALENNEALTPPGYNLVRVGERSGQLPAMLRSLGRLHEESGRTRMKRVLALIEPAAILIIGGVVGVVILGVILALVSANDIAI